MELHFSFPLAPSPLYALLALLTQPGVSTARAEELFACTMKCQPVDQALKPISYSVGCLIARSDFATAVHLVHAFVQHGVDVDRYFYTSPGSNQMRGSMLHDAALNGSADVMALLLKAGGDPTRPMSNGDEPCHSSHNAFMFAHVGNYEVEAKAEILSAWSVARQIAEGGTGLTSRPTSNELLTQLAALAVVQSTKLRQKIASIVGDSSWLTPPDRGS